MCVSASAFCLRTPDGPMIARTCPHFTVALQYERSEKPQSVKRWQSSERSIPNTIRAHEQRTYLTSWRMYFCLSPLPMVKFTFLNRRTELSMPLLCWECRRAIGFLNPSSVSDAILLLLLLLPLTTTTMILEFFCWLVRTTTRRFPCSEQ